jgi:hypothetical protein
MSLNVVVIQLEKYNMACLGLKTIAHPAAGGTFSYMATFLWIFERSWLALPGSFSRAALAASGQLENSVGTGPATASQSKRQHARGHSASSAVGTLSLRFVE